MRRVENALHRVASWLSRAGEWLDLFAISACNWKHVRECNQRQERSARIDGDAY